jgi:uncharacterized protein (TIGR03437 family)
MMLAISGLGAMTMARYCPVAVIFGLAVFGGLSSARAQVPITCPSQFTQPTLAYGQRLTDCTLSQPTAQDLYSFAGTANDLIRVSLFDEGGQAVPCVEIFDPGGTLVGGQGCLTDFSITLGQTGSYEIAVQGQRAAGIFQYDLRLDRIFPVSPTSIAMGIGDMDADSISYLGQYNLYHFTGFQGQVMWMDMTQRGGSGVPCIQVYGPNRNTIFGPYCTNGGFTAPYTGPAYFTFNLDSTGTYVISVNVQGDAQLAQYQLRLQRIVPVIPTARAIPFGGSIQGQVGPLGQMDMVYFDIAGGDYVYAGFTSDSVGGAFYYPAGNLMFGPIELGGGISFAGTLSAAGRYTLLLSGPDNAQNSYSYSNAGTASYSAFANCTGGCPSAPSNGVGTLSVVPATLSFRVSQGSANVVTQTVQVSATNQDVQLLLTPITDSWLSVTPTVGSLPATLQVLVNPSGLPAKTYSSKLILQSESGAMTQIPISLVVNPPPLTITTASLPGALVGVPYGPMQLATSGAAGTTLWSQTGLPSSTGLNLSTAGVLSGTPTTGSQGTYALSITATNSGTTVSTQLSLTISSPATLSVLNFRLATTGGGGVSAMQAFSVASGNPSTTTVQVSASAPWIVLNQTTFPLGGSVQSQPIGVQINQQALPPGTSYIAGTINITGLGSPEQVEVNVALEDVPGLPLLSRSAMAFTVDVNQPYSQFLSNVQQTVTIINDGPNPVRWQVTPSESFVTPTPDISTTPLLPGDEMQVSVTVSDTNLVGGVGTQAAVYQAMLSFIFNEDNTLLQLPVTVNVPAKGSAPLAEELLLDQTGLIFASGAAQPVLATNLTGQSYAMSVTPQASWIHVSPITAVKQLQQSFNVSVDPSAAPLDAAGVARGYITVAYQSITFSQQIEVLFIGAPAASSASSSGPTAVPAVTSAPAACVPKSLQAVFSRLSEGSTVPAGLPAQVDAQLSDSCGGAVTTGAAVVSFSNGDRPVVLLPAGNGSWQGSWQPANPSNAVLSLAAVSGQLVGIATRSVQIGSNGAALPDVPTGSVLNAASLTPFVDRVAPGSIISIFGTQLASQTTAATFPLPLTLATTQVQLGTTVLPLLYVSPSQINAIIPPGITMDASPSLVVNTGGLQSIPLPVAPVQTDPGIFGVAVDSATGTVISPSAPAHRGDIVVLYCTGLGAVSGSLDPTLPTSTSSLFTTQAPVAVFIRNINGNWESSHVPFAGLAPGYSGLYQVNVQIPDDAATGGQVPMYVLAGNMQSNQVLISVQ